MEPLVCAPVWISDEVREGFVEWSNRGVYALLEDEEGLK